jgi:alpha-tubulin suppressor-like RCC1 family protein
MGRTVGRGVFPFVSAAGLFAVLGTMAMACESVLGLDDARVRPSDAGMPRDADGTPEAADPTPGDSGADAEGGGMEPVWVVASLSKHTCAVGPDRRAYCWGDNTEGQLGDGTTEPRNRPVLVAPFDDVVDVSAGYTHSCLVRSNSDVYCWGKNDRGQLGDGTKKDRHDTSVLTMSDAVKVGVAGWHTCAVTTLRGVRCWGDNYYGALGDHTYTASTRYVDVKGLSDVKSLAVGVMHNCAATDQGWVYCWGRSAFGQLGTGYMDVDAGGGFDPVDPGSAIAQRVPGLTDVAEVASGEDHTCAARINGQVVCWGRNDYAQAGDLTGAVTKADRTTPGPVVGDLGYTVHLSAGGFDSCATGGPGGKLRCWGQNNFGQLGNGNTSPGQTMPSPPIIGLTDVLRLSTGEHACAWRRDAKLFCWGRNDVGQLGLGRVSDYELQPQEVTFPATSDAGP